jgi:hypothetical protein
MRFAESNKDAEIRDKYRTYDMTINMSTHFARLPGAQAPFYVWSRFRDFGINLLAQQRSGFKYRAMNRLIVIQLTDSRIKQRDYVVDPFMRLCRTDLADRYRGTPRFLQEHMQTEWHSAGSECGDMHEPRNQRVISSLRDHGAAIGVVDEDDGLFLVMNDLASCHHVIGQVDSRILHDAHIVPVLLQNLVNAFPARAVNKPAMD